MKRLTLLGLFLLLAIPCFALTGSGGGGGGGGATPYPTPTCGTDINSGCTQVTGINGNGVQFKINDRGSTASPACDFTLGYVCRFATTANATLTVSNIPGSATNPVQVEIDAYSSGANNTLSFPSTFYGLGAGGAQANAGVSPVINIYQGSGGVPVFHVLTARCDGTNCYLVSNIAQSGQFGTLAANSVTVNGGGTTAGSVVVGGSGNVTTVDGFYSSSGNGGSKNSCSGFITLAAGVGNSVVSVNSNTATGANLAGSCIKSYTKIACIPIQSGNVGAAPATPANTPGIVQCYASPTATATAGMAATATQTAIWAVASTSNATYTILWWGQY